MESEKQKSCTIGAEIPWNEIWVAIFDWNAYIIKKMGIAYRIKISSPIVYDSYINIVNRMVLVFIWLLKNDGINTMTIKSSEKNLANWKKSWIECV